MPDQPSDLELLQEALEAMLLDNEDISARAAVRRLAGTYKHATDITRRPQRRDILSRYQQKQAELRAVMEKADKQSKTNLSAQLVEKVREIDEVTRQRNLLIGSHRAMIHAMSQLRGRKGWLALFEHHQAAVNELESLGAVPSADVAAFPAQPKGRK